VLSSLGDNLPIPHNPDPAGDDVLSIVGGHLNVHSSSVVLKLSWHLRIPIVVPDAADFGFTGVYCSGELVDPMVGFHESLVGDGGSAAYYGDETICDGTCGVSEVIVLHAEDGFS